MTIRLYHPGALTGVFYLEPRASHHWLQVLRAQVGDACVVFNGEGGEYHATLIAIDKKRAQVQVGDYRLLPVAPLQLHLGHALAKGDKMEWVMQKATELGVTAITPLITERSQVKLNDARREKKIAQWQAIAISACEQSGRDRVPLIHAPQLLSTWVAAQKVELKLVLAVSAASASLPAAAKNISILIGPEGGLSAAEMQLAHHHDFLSWHLGPRVLRTETAAITALSVLQYRFGDLG